MGDSEKKKKTVHINQGEGGRISLFCWNPKKKLNQNPMNFFGLLVLGFYAEMPINYCYNEGFIWMHFHSK